MKKPKDLVLLIVTLLIGVLLGLQIKVVRAMSVSQAQKVYYKVANTNFFTVPKLNIEESDDADCYWNGYSVNITTAFLALISNEDEAAFVFAHELGHYQQAHWGRKRVDERLADQLGAKFARRAGYNPCRGIKLLLKHGKESDDHDSPVKRCRDLGCYKESK